MSGATLLLPFTPSLNPPTQLHLHIKRFFADAEILKYPVF